MDLLLDPISIFQNPQATQANATVTTSGTSLVLTGYGGCGDVVLVVNLRSAPTGTTPTITWTLQEIDPGDNTTVLASVTGPTMSAVGTQKLTLPGSVSGSFKVSWAVTGTTPSFAGVYATLLARGFTEYATLVGPTGQALLGAATTAGSIPVNIASDQTLTAALSGTEYSSSYPDPSDYPMGTSGLSIDGFGNLQVRSTVFTDEGSARDDFSGPAFTSAIPGTVSFVAGSVNVTGVGTTFTAATTPVRAGWYIKKTADGEANYAQIAFINSDTSLTLVTPYAGTTATVAAVSSRWQTITGPGSFSFATQSILAISSGTTAGTITIRSLGDILPYTFSMTCAISQRIANQYAGAGFQDLPVNPAQQAVVIFTGTDNTKVALLTSFSANANDQQLTTVTIPNGGTSNQFHTYRIDLSALQATLSIDGIVVVRHQTHLPEPYTALYVTGGFSNSATVGTATVLQIDSIVFQNIDRVQIDDDFLGEALTVSSLDQTGQGTLTALGSVIGMVGGCSTIAFDITGTYAGTVVFEVQAGDSQWTAVQAWVPATSSLVTALNSSAALCVVSCGGYTQVRARVSAYTSGTVNITWNAGAGENVQQTVLIGANVVQAQLAASVVDRTVMQAGQQLGLPVMGQSSGVGRIIRTNRLGNVVPGYQTLQAYDAIEGTTINSWLWAQSAVTMTISQTTGVLTLNASATVTAATYAILTSNRQFVLLNQAPVGCSFRSSIAQTTNAVQEVGFGSPAGTTAIVSNGAFFRISASGTVKLVTSFNGTETASAALATLVSTSYYLFIVIVEDNGARFILEDSNGVPLIDTSLALPVGTAGVGASSHLPCFARVYTTAAAGTAPTIRISSFQVWQYDINTSKPWPEQLAAAGKSSGIDPTLFTATTQFTTTAPTTGTPTNTTVRYPTLGGEYSISQVAGSENLLGIFGYQVPSPYTLFITEILLPPPIVTTTLGATYALIEWALMAATTNNPSTALGPKYPLAMFTAAANAPVGTIFTGATALLSLRTPLVVLPGQYALVVLKVVSGIAAGVYRGTIMINGYFE